MSEWTKTPEVGDEISVNLDGTNYLLKAVDKTTCSECFMYGKGRKHYNDYLGFKCWNFCGNKTGVWLNCGSSYRPNHDSIMFKLIK